MRDKVVVVTGASSGIGAALAQSLGALGVKQVLVARRRELLDEVARAAGGESLVVAADVCARAAVEGVVAAALARFGHIDAWVNNAGRGISRPTSQLTDEDLDDMMRVNVKSALYGMQAVLPHMKARGAGHLVNVSSMLARIPFAHIRSAYCAAKAALDSLTATLRLELATEHPGIVVSTVHPGVVATDFGKSALHGGPDSRALPMAQPVAEVAQVIAELLANPRADVYTRPGMREQAAAYYGAEDMAAFERQLLSRR